jgi:PKD repeat protein
MILVMGQLHQHQILLLQGPDGVVYAVFKHAYQNLGTYNPTVQVTSPCGSSVTLPAGNITISTNNSLDDEAGFFFNESKYYCLNEPIEFLAYGASTYEWNFGDGTGTYVSNCFFNTCYACLF